ncbi:MAG: MBL fold metallo-hydrolase, partial [Hasllibacter sp.]
MRLLAALFLLALPAAAQEAEPLCPLRPPPMAALRPAALHGPAPAAGSVALRYVEHSMVLIETPGGASAITDYFSSAPLGGFAPDLATMNRGHSTHWTPSPDPAIGTVLRGWTEPREAALVDLAVRGVPTDLRGGPGGGMIADGNAIFVFRVGEVCIAHLGHLHHEPTETDYAALGRIDVAIAPVDGGLTLPHETLVRTLERLQAAVVVPVHWFERGTLEAFASRMDAAGWRIEVARASAVTLSGPLS